MASKDYGGMLLNDCFTKEEYQTVTEVNFIQEITSYCKENKMNAVYFLLVDIKLRVKLKKSDIKKWVGHSTHFLYT
ncbi:hypothetical protein [Vagococcus sp.]|uniref:hypothetical protein n=1 Tax=Vagococcus sp. TaxID=1933889 RepID=UPI002FC76145